MKEKLLLIVDDDDMVRETVRFVAESIEGVKTMLASTCEEAFELAQQYPVDLIISDLNMPGEEGVWLVHHLKEKGKNIPVVIYSGSITAGDDKKLLRMGAAKVLSKPADPLVMKKTILTFLGK